MSSTPHTAAANPLATAAIPRLLLRLAVPSIIAQLVNMLYNIVDRIFIGHLPDNGQVALTGVGVTMPIIILIAAFTMLAGMGGAPRAAIRMGEGDIEGAERIMGNVMTLLMLFSAVLVPLLLIFREPLLLLFGASGETLGYGSEYLQIFLIGTFFSTISVGMNAFITTQGYAGLAMRTILIGAILNIALDSLLMYGLNMGVRGAAVATVISQAVSSAWVLWILLGGRLPLRLRRRHLRLERRVVAGILALGFSPFIMQATEAIVGVSLNSSLQRYGGDLAVGAMTILTSLMQILMLPMLGLTQGAQPIISFNYGARQVARCRQAMRLQLLLCVAYACSFFAIMMAAPAIAIRLFSPAPQLIAFTVWAGRIFMFGSFALGVQIGCQQSFLALGQAKVSSRLAMLRKLVFLIPLVFILPLWISNRVFAVFLAEPIADILAATVTLLTYLRVIPQLMRERAVEGEEGQAGALEA